MLKTVFMGTPEIVIPSLKALWEDKDVDIKLVVSMPDRPSGRGLRLQSPPVIDFAKKHDIPYYQSSNINNDAPLWDRLQSLKPDILIVFAFSQFLSDKLLALPSLGPFNIHTSLLPKFRGANPIVHAILQGEHTTGVSIQKMVKSMDAGDVAHVKEVEIGPRETALDLSNKLMHLASVALLEFKDKLITKTVSYTPQNHDEATFAPILKKEKGLLNIQVLDFTQLDRMVRAFYPRPGAHLFLNGKRLKIFQLQKSLSTVAPGEIDEEAEGLVIGHKGGAFRALEVQLEGKKRCFDTDLLNGLNQKDRPLKISLAETS